MTYFNPELSKVTVYRWDDANAPQKSEIKNSLITIIKACLVTGYGDKKGAGWSMPFEDNDEGIKVFRPAQGIEHDFYLKMSADDGTQTNAELLVNMTAIDNGDSLIAYDSPYKYAKSSFTDRWVLIASDRSFWLFTEQKNGTYENVHRKGSFFFCGDTAKSGAGDRCILLDYTAGNGDYASFNGLFDNLGYYRLLTKAYIVDDDKVVTVDRYLSAFEPHKATDDNNVLLADIVIAVNNTVYPLIGAFTKSNTASELNFTMLYDQYLIAPHKSNGEYVNIAIDGESWTY